MSTESGDSTMISQQDFVRLETKVDKLGDALNKIILFEERQSVHGKRIGDLETQLALLKQQSDLTDQNVSKWINRGIGVWGLAVSLWAIIRFIGPLINPILGGH